MELLSYPTFGGFGYMTCFGQWNLAQNNSKPVASFVLKRHHTFPLISHGTSNLWHKKNMSHETWWSQKNEKYSRTELNLEPDPTHGPNLNWNFPCGAKPSKPSWHLQSHPADPQIYKWEITLMVVFHWDFVVVLLHSIFMEIVGWYKAFLKFLTRTIVQMCFT